MEYIRENIKNITTLLNSKANESLSISESDLSCYGLSGIALRPYQMEGVRWMIERYKTELGFILADEMGLGKTCQTISYLVYLYGSNNKLSQSLLLVPLSVLNNWTSELKRFAPGLKFICYTGNLDERTEIRKMIRGQTDILIILTTYEICLKDTDFLSGLTWHNLVVDEAHRLKNRQSQLHQALLSFDFAHRILLTGTPVQNNLDELYSLLSFVQPKVFKQKYADNFIWTYKDVASSSDSDISEILFPFLLRRLKSQVLHDLPKKTEIVLYHRLSLLQKKYYKAILTKDIDAFESESRNKTRLNNILMQLRKCVIHPYLFDGVEPEPFELGEHFVQASGKLAVLDKLLEFLHQNKHKVLIFSQMTRVLDILQDYMGFRGYSYERLDGSVRAEERFLAVRNFNEDESTFAFLLSTKAGGQGLNLTAADTVVFVDSDFNPQNDLQAADRVHRIGQLRNVKVIRLIGRSTVEEIITKRAEEKLQLTKAVISAGQSTSATDKNGNEELNIGDILKFGLDKLFKSDDNPLDNIDFAAVLGQSIDGEWQADFEISDGACADHVESPSNDNLYTFEGKDYSKEPSAGDLKSFQQIIEERNKTLEAEEGGRTLRRNNQLSEFHAGLSLDLPIRKPRKQLTPEELEERRRKRKEAAAIRAKEEEAKEKRREQDRRKRREEMWKQNNYKSCRIETSSDEEDSDYELEDDEEGEINFVVGDVTHPQNTGNCNAIIVHCLNDSGIWGAGGLFTSLSQRSLLPEQQYAMARKMKDLALGDVHIVSVDDIHSRQMGEDWLAMIIAQKKDVRGNVSGIKMDALQNAFKKLSAYAKVNKASVHLPRIGYKTTGFNWYGTERLIRKYFALKGIPTYIYYFPRKSQHRKRKQDATDQPAEAQAKRVAYQATSTPATALDSLPNFMNGVFVYFHDMSEETKKQMSRYIIAYDGDVQKSMDSSTTHVIVSGDNTDEQFKESLVTMLKDLHVAENVKIVKHQWLLDSVRKQSLVDPEMYKAFQLNF